MTSVEIPVSIAAALPNLTVLDITNDVRREVAGYGGSGIADVSPNGDPSLIRLQERETGLFTDMECMPERLVTLSAWSGHDGTRHSSHDSRSACSHSSPSSRDVR